jgi:hypothetical protein
MDRTTHLGIGLTVGPLRDSDSARLRASVDRYREHNDQLARTHGQASPLEIAHAVALEKLKRAARGVVDRTLEPRALAHRELVLLAAAIEWVESDTEITRSRT